MSNRSVADERRGSRRNARQKGRLKWLCNPLVWKTITALAQFGYELVRLLRH
jgi:hypothetical protein